ncbi:hypothetical protein GEMRC1_001127 [Eukaryota sp. GEM-RC1]
MMTMAYVVGSLARRHGYVMDTDLEDHCKLFIDVELYSDVSTLPIDLCYYRAYVMKYALKPEFESDQMLFSVPSTRKPQCLPQWNATDVGRGIIQGSVSDENSYAAGGVLGHAGLFSTGKGMLSFVKRILENDVVNATTLKTFGTVANSTFSSRALGWDTNYPDGYSCGTLAPETFMHLGYTGTMVCIDPTRDLALVLLTNRTYPNKDKTSVGKTRHLFSTFVQQIYDKFYV